MPYDPPPDLSAMSLAEIAALVEARKLPPIDQWTPRESGDSGMKIAADGTWFHDGGPISRPAMVRAFSSLLTRDDDGSHWLVTPHQRLSIEVEDAAFMAVDLRESEGSLAFRLNTDDIVIAGPAHSIIARGDRDTPAIYVEVRNTLEARLNRSTYAQLAEIAIAGGDMSVRSNGTEFSLIPS